MLTEILNTLPQTNKKVICILSGGLDSTVLLYLLKKKYNDNVIALSFNYNQRHSYELEMARKTCSKTNIPHKILPIEFFGNLVSNVSALSNDSNIEVPELEKVLGDPQPPTYVPYRNLIFISLALSFAEANDASHVFIGVQSVDLYGYWDTTMEFIKRVNDISELNRQHQIQIVAPFNQLLKSDEIQIGQTLNVPFENCWSCYSGPNENNEACGECATCCERIKSFMTVGIKDSIQYSNDPFGDKND